MGAAALAWSVMAGLLNFNGDELLTALTGCADESQSQFIVSQARS